VSVRSKEELLEEAYWFIQGDVETWGHDDGCDCLRCTWLKEAEEHDVRSFSAQPKAMLAKPNKGGDEE
jgi:hypothetical protein